ncbi:MAG: arylesterase [Nitrospiraceae bacterium]
MNALIPFALLPAATLLMISSWTTVLAMQMATTYAPGQAVSSPTELERRDPRPRIVAFGDSLTAGFGVSQDQAYPSQLESKLASLGYDYEVVNAGVSGETTAGGLRRVGWILKSKPRLVVLELGGNDGLRGLSLSETRSNLDTIIRKLKEAHVQVVLAGMKLPPNYGEEYTRQFEAIYRELASRHHLPFVPFFLEGVGGKSGLNQADGIHPTAEGHRIIAETVLQTVRPLLNRSEGADNLSPKKKA